MTTATKPAEDSAEKRKIKKLTIEITDQDALLAAYPGVKITVQKDIVDRKKLRPIVNALHEVGATVPGVKAYYASEVSESPDDDEDDNARAALA